MLKSFSASSPARQLTVILVAAALICAALAAAYLKFLQPGYSVLFGDLRAADAATIVAELDKQKVPYRLEQQGTRILVPADVADATRLGIMGTELPLKGAVGFELFNKSDMGLTEFAQKINYQRALQGELARTIMSMEAVESARVHLSLPERRIFRDEQVAPKASVTVVPRDGERLSRPAVRGVQRLVAAAVPDLDAANVVVLDAEGEVMSGDDPVIAAPSSSVEQKQSVEAYYAGEVGRALARVYPAVDAEVAVWAGPPPRLEEADAAPAPQYDRWTTSSRTFRLRVAITVDDALDSQVQEEIRLLAGEVIGLDPVLDDVVTIAALGGGRAGGESWDADRTATRLPVRTDAEPSASSGLGMWAAFTLAALVGGLMLLRRRERKQAGLSPEQRADYAARFQTLLERSEADAA